MFLLLTVHCLLLTPVEFRTGLDGHVSRAYVEIQLEDEEGKTYNIDACARVLDIQCRDLNSLGGCQDPCRNRPSDCRSGPQVKALFEGLYGIPCPGSHVPVRCPDNQDVNDPDSPICNVFSDDPKVQPRAGMPVGVSVAPLASDGNVLAGKTFVGLSNACNANQSYGNDFCHSYKPSDGTRRYSFALGPQKLFVPTEDQFSKPLSLFKDGKLLSKFDENGNEVPDTKAINDVLTNSEGAYVEGVIRFEPVTQSLVVSRRGSRGP